MKQKKSGKRWRSFLCGFIAVGCVLSSIPTGAFAAPAQETAENDNQEVIVESNDLSAENAAPSGVATLAAVEEDGNLIAGIPYTTKVADKDYHGSHADREHVKLTDGKKAADWYSSNSVGFYIDTRATIVDLTFSMEQEISFQEISFGVQVDTSSGIGWPSTVLIESKNGNEEWQPLYNGKISGLEKTTTFVFVSENDAITATDLRITMHGGNSWLFMDEVEVFTEPSGEDAFGSLGGSSEPPEQPTNFLKGCSYQTTMESGAPYEDSGTQLTDEKQAASAAYGDSAWVGYFVSGDPIDFVFDMGVSQSFNEFQMGFLNDAAPGILLPDAIKVFISDDNQTWTQLNTKSPTFDVVVDLGEKQSFEQVKVGFLCTKLDVPSRTIYRYSYKASSPIEARYIKVTTEFDRSRGWFFTDEAKALKYPERAASFSSSDTRSVVSPNADRSNTNNIATGRTYVTSWSAMAARPDDAGKLTDGRRGTDSYTSKEWVGYDAANTAGNIQNYSALSSELPSAIKVQYSNDQVKWLDATQKDLPEYASAGNGAKRYVERMVGTVKARYVKFTMNIGNNVAIDEIEILKTAEPDEVEGNPDVNEEINLIKNYDYTYSRAASFNKKTGLLTDGIYGALGVPPSSAWSGWKYSASNPAKNHIALTFDATAFCSASKIQLNTRSNSSGKISFPKNVVLKVSTNGNDWIQLKSFADVPDTSTDSIQKFIWDGSVDAFSSSRKNANMAYLRYARFEFDLTSNSTTYIDEVEMIGKHGKCSTAGVVVDPPGELYNVALGKTYITERKGPDNLYPDSGNSELTDGIFGTQTLADPAWAGFVMSDYPDGNRWEQWPLKTIIIDLEDTKTISSIQFNMLSDSVRGFNQPWAVRTFASMDGVEWTGLSDNNFVNIWPSKMDSYGWHFKDTTGKPRDLVGLPTVTARYVRVDFELVNRNAMDEIVVMGYDGVKDGAILPKGRLYDNGYEYLKPGKDTTNGVTDMVLCYNGDYGVDTETQTLNGNWKPEQFKPYLTYINTEDESVDTMFDTIMFLALDSRYGRWFLRSSQTGREPYQAADVDWYFDKMFRSGGDVESLNVAAKQASIDLENPDYKANMVIMIPSVDPSATNFGVLGGRDLNLSRQEDRDFLLNWYVDEMIRKITEGHYDYISFKGFYWLDEGAGYTREIVQDAADKTHEVGYCFYWIPYLRAPGPIWAKDMGIDACALQPNHFFEHSGDPHSVGGGGTKLVRNTAQIASYANIGIEIECDGSMTTDPAKYNQYLDYLNAGVEAKFGGPDVYRNWYQGVRTMADLAHSTNATIRRAYDYTYQLIKGTLTKTIPYIISFDNDDGSGYNPEAGGSGGSGSGSGGGGATRPPRPENPTEPEKPTTGKTTWEKTNGVWKLKDADGKYVTGWKKVNGNWYYMNANAVMQTGWQKIGNTWYYLKDSGAMATGWQKIGNQWYYLKSSGAMAIGWNWIGGKCYYLNANGQMAANTTIGGYKVGSDGAWIH